MDDDGLLDWEMLHGSDSESTDSIISEMSSSVINDGMILSDHFSADSLVNMSHSEVESGDSNPVEVGVDLGLDDCVRNELGIYDSKTGTLGDGEVRLSGSEAGNEKHIENDAAAELTGGTVSHYVSDDLEVGVEEPIEDLGKSWSGSVGNELVSGDSGIVSGEDEIVSDSGVASTEEIEGNVVEVGPVRSGDEGKNRETVWWKMPFVLLKYSVFKIGPVWSVSMAAAVMGLVLLGRRLYNIKKKAQRFHLRVTIDDKKASRVMSQAARLNEVFTEVRRVPVIRPALPSPGAWPVLSLR
ncbi:hypothetical protein CARUB_v10001586mg [Capsella rubella]|uniref:DUF6821 domain-containing protein n=1 Tax=Capsella rubella TaxID=81985 RepID=R0FG37_9BRAS|nr:uncharacterized protein LOC17883283 [Capsella rubella]EOA21237.1 hypothetical protein CARUB_v10001586mg [Capsella rubella]